MRSISFGVVSGALAVIGLAGQAQAALTLKIDWAFGANGFRTVSLDTASTVALQERAGEFTATYDNKSFAAFCIELPAALQIQTTYSGYTVVPGASYNLLSPTVVNNLGRLYSEGITISNATQGAAFQLALWELAYETGPQFDVSTGTATFAGRNEQGAISVAAGNPSAISLANQYLAALPAVSTYQVFFLKSPNSPNTQDLIYASPLPSTVPEPPTVNSLLAGLAAMGLIGLGRARRWG